MSDSLNTYHNNALACSKITTLRYSTSFSMGIRLFAPKFRPSIFAIYGFVRYADEIVDTFHHQDKLIVLNEFKSDTYKAIERQFSTNPMLHSFQLIVNQYNIPTAYIDAFLYSMEMDIDKQRFTDSELQDYIYGSAEVIGLMCLKVFCHGNDALFDKLYLPGRKLGDAFQRINFLRDIKSDYDERGRVYFQNYAPDIISEQNKNELVQHIESLFKEAFIGIKQLPRGSRLGVYLAYTYYLALTRKIKKKSVDAIKTSRIRVGDFEKIMIFIKVLRHNIFL